VDLEPDLSGDFADDLDGNAGRVPNPFGPVGGVSEGKFDERKTAARALEQRHGAIAILDGGWMDLQHKGAAIRIDHDVALATHDL